MCELGKWGWIALKLEEMHECKLSEMAQKIDDHMNELYGTTITLAWLNNYKPVDLKYTLLAKDDFKGKLSYLSLIASSIQFCVACNIDTCGESCRYRDKYGGCAEDTTEYKQFTNALTKEIHTERTGDDLIVHLF